MWGRANEKLTDEVEETNELTHAALLEVPDIRSAIQEGGASFDALFWAHYARWPVKSKHLVYEDQERAALHYLYPQVRRSFEKAHGRIEEEYWCVSVPAGVVRTLDEDGLRAECCAIVDWKQGDADLVAPMLELDQIEIGTQFICDAGKAHCEAQHLIFDAYSSALDALETRHSDGITDQAKELKLIEQQVATARNFLQSAGQRWARSESLRGMACAAVDLLLWAAVIATFLWVTGIDATGLPSRLVAWAVAGAVGACLSVLVRVSDGDYAPNWEATREELWRDGISRPISGALFGIAVPIFVISGLASLSTDLKDATDLKTQLVYLGLGIGAGFSERWARDLIAKQPSVLGSKSQTAS